MLALNLWRGNTFYVLLCLVFASIIQFYLGQQFYSNAWKSVKHKSANMDVLIVIGTTAAYAYGIILILYGFPDSVVHYGSAGT
jgi:Cu+-exporting ATPase